MRRLRALAFTLSSLLVCIASARAQTDVRQERSWAVRGEAYLVSGQGVFGATAGSAAVTFQKVLWRRLSWEETVGWGVGNRRVDGKDAGVLLAGTLRWAPLVDARGVHALTVAVGSALMFAGGYGTLNFAVGEVGYEYRAPGRLTLLAALGPDVLVNTPKRDVCAGAGWFCSNFERGRVAPLGHVRVGVGFTF